MNIFNRLADRFAKVAPLPEGMHHLQSESADKKPYRVHLRLRRDGSGVFIVNAATVLHLNPTAAEYAYHFVKGVEPGEVAEQVAARYRVQKSVALEDYRDFLDRIQTLVASQDVDPVSYLNFERIAPHSADLTAPLRLDCALTYKLPAHTKAEYAPARRVERELTTDEWKSILDTAWRMGVPHVTFTGGEPTLREDLPDLIAHAEKNGQVCGLLSDGLKLADKNYRQSLLQTGLDHLLFLLQPDDETSWRALEAIMPEDIFVTAHITLDGQNVKNINAALERLAALQVKSISLSLADLSLKSELDPITQKAADLNLALNFDLPVPYSAQNPVAFETAADGIPSGAGKAWLYVEPDGDVLPAQGMAENVLGNLLRDKWEKIYAASKVS
ncbi:MAG: Coenzyme PQQ synthesis protein E [Anaerolineales bacterium]|nr:Coenzyme PQQ synthesis protein E [Anaerolineales bacterium]